VNNLTRHAIRDTRASRGKEKVGEDTGTAPQTQDGGTVIRQEPGGKAKRGQDNKDDKGTWSQPLQDRQDKQMQSRNAKAKPKDQHSMATSTSFQHLLLAKT